MKKACIIFILFLIYGMSVAQVMVNVQVLPPYSTYLPDYFNYSNRVVLTLVSTTGQANVKLSATISGDNGITVTTNPQFQPPAPIHMDQNIMVSLTGGDLQNYLDYNNAKVTGIDKNTLFHGSGIPEGVYTLCIQALDYATGMPLSDPSPAGCSNPFDVKYVDPPVLISPSCGDSVSPDNQQSIVFSWVPSQGTPVTTQYKFKIVELIPPNRNPNDAMNSATTPPFYETTVNSLVFVYGPSEPFLQPGHSYAWRVTAVDAYSIQPNTTGLLQYVNNGASEVCWFKEGTGAHPVNQYTCDCQCIPAIYPVLKQGNTWSYEAGGVYSCSGYCPVGQEAIVCEKKNITYAWSVNSGMDVASISGKSDSKTVELKINKKGGFSLTLKTTLECTCSSCKGSTTLVETVTTVPPPTTGCQCIIQSEIIGGEPIKVDNPLAAYVKPMIKADGKPSKNQTLAVGLSVLATDNDDLIHRCILGKPWEKLVENVGDPVSYSWTIEKGADAKIIGEKQGKAMLILPYDIKPKDVLDYRIKCTISSNADEDLTGYINVKVTGADTCEYIMIKTDVEAMSKGTKKTPELKKPGDCEPVEKPTWLKADDIVANLKIPAFVPVGELTLIGLDAFDSDRVTIRCESKRDGCGNPEYTLPIAEGLKFEWSDGSAGGTFEPVTNGNGAIYRAPLKAGEVTITCKINDAGNHREASGETKTVSGKIKVVDVMRALFMGDDPDTVKRKFLTVGLETKLRPVFIKQPVPELLKADWCLDLGGSDGMMKASVLKSKKALKPEDLKLKILADKGNEKDKDLVVYWKNHHHIHGKHPLICKTTYRFPSNEIPYIDGDWQKSNFLEEKEPEIFKLFFNLYSGDLTTFDGKNVESRKKVGKLDDGKWRENAAKDDDIYGKESALNGENDIGNWLLHWASETYDPAVHGYSLLMKIPLFIYRPGFSSKSSDGKTTYPFAEYRWVDPDKNKIYLSDQLIQPVKSPGLSKKNFRFVNSDDIDTVFDVIMLPKFDLIGLGTAIKCINHEMAHYEAVTKRWENGVAWNKLYGEHTVIKEWKTVNTGDAVDLTKVKPEDCEGHVHKYFEYTIQGSGDINVSATSKRKKSGNAKELYNFTLKFHNAKFGKGGNTDSVIIKIPKGWLVDGELKNDNKALSSNFIIYSQIIGGIELIWKNNGGDTIEVHKSQGEIKNGIIVYGRGQHFWVFERHNDSDGDFLPNAAEDSLGTNWVLGRTHTGAYHSMPNDQEFWAEWRSGDLINPVTGKLKDGECEIEKDWANPGLQTEIEKK